MAVLAKICKIKKTVISMSSEDDGGIDEYTMRSIFLR